MFSNMHLQSTKDIEVVETTVAPQSDRKPDDNETEKEVKPGEEKTGDEKQEEGATAKDEA